VALVVVFGLAVLWRHVLTPEYQLSAYWQMAPCLTMLLAAFWVQGLYPGVLLHPAEEMKRVVFSGWIVFLVMASTAFLWRTAEMYSRSVFLVTWAAAAPTVLLARHGLRRKLGRKRWWGVPAVVLGSGPSAQRVVRSLGDGSRGVKVVAVVSADRTFWPEDLPPVVGHLAVCPEIAASRGAKYAILAMPERSSIETRNAIQDYCSGFSHVFLVPDMPGICSSGVSAREIGGEFGLEMPQRLFHRTAAITKRIVDLMAGTAVLALASPIFLGIAVLVKLSSKGSVFYRDCRLGRGGKEIFALKFRTMAPDAPAVLAEYLEAHPELRREWLRDHKLKNDPRVTKVGRWLRRLSLDELPQLLNVLAGDMSLVGPRPIVRAEVPKYGRGYGLYTRVRPGLTGLWQVSGRNNTTYDERVAFDEYYVRNWSIWMDVYILIRTVRVVLTGEGAY
jgi:Undecaprenyl-phosphate galactose phosphotransferase WbaP